MSIAIDAGSWWQMRGHRCDFPMYACFISPNALDLSLNGWQPECVVHDTDPFQLLRIISLLPDGQSRRAWVSVMLSLYSAWTFSLLTSSNLLPAHHFQNYYIPAHLYCSLSSIFSCHWIWVLFHRYIYMLNNLFANYCEKPMILFSVC